MNDAGRIGFVLKDAYNPLTTYEALDVVYSRNATYAAKTTTTGVLPTSTATANWQLLIDGDINGLNHHCTINPSGTEYTANWLLEEGVLITPDSKDIYRVEVDGKERLYFWDSTNSRYSIVAGGGHTLVNDSGTAVAARDNLQFNGMNIEDDPTNNKTIVHAQLKICPTQAEWNLKSDAEKNDPNTYWVLPWASGDFFATDKTPVGTVIQVTAAKTGEVTGITTPTGAFPSKDYLVCDGAVKQIADYPKLANHFTDVYGSSNYFGGNGTTTFAVPDFTTDFPENGVLSIKAQISTDIITIATVDDSIATGENVWSASKTSAIKTQADNLRSESAVLGAKNLLKNTATSNTVNGVTFTVNSDGTITANGTATENINFNFEFPFNLNGNYLFSGCPTDGTFGKYYVYIWDGTTNARVKKWDGITACDSDFGNGNVECQLLAGHRLFYVMNVMQNFTASNLTFKPMIRLASDPDSTYVPYAMTNRELTDLDVKKLSLLPIRFDGNCDDLSAGMVYVTSEATHKPAAWIILLTFSSSSANLKTDYMAQLGFSITSNNVYYRMKANNTWGSWYRLTGTVVS